MPALATGHLALTLLLLAPAAFFPFKSSPYEQGQVIEIAGTVTDRQGNPLPDLTVVLEASRHRLKLRELRRVEEDATRRTAKPDAQGHYTLEWQWDRYYNHHELLLTVPLNTREGPRLRVLHAVDISKRIKGGSPVVIPLVLEDTSFLESLRRFLATIESEDQRRAYQERGKPDRVRVVDHLSHKEVTWWYFEAGQVVRFRDGRLEQVEPFEPVKGFED